MGPFESVSAPVDMLRPVSSKEGCLCLNIHQISTPIRRSPSTPPTTPPTIAPISVRLSFGEAAGGAVDEADVVLDEESEEVAVGEFEEVVEDPNGSPMSLPLPAICCASVSLNRELVQSLASC